MQVKKLIGMFGMAMLATAALACGALASLAGGPIDTIHGDGATLQVVNNGSVEICYVYISIPENAEWGEDMLNNLQTIGAGESIIFNVAPASYDVRAESCGGDYVEEYGYQISNATTWSVSLSF